MSVLREQRHALRDGLSLSPSNILFQWAVSPIRDIKAWWRIFFWRVSSAACVESWLGLSRKKICDSYLKCVLVARPTEQEISSRVDRIVVSICFYSTEMCVKLPAVRFLNSDQDYCPKSDINFLPVMSGTGKWRKSKLQVPRYLLDFIAILEQFDCVRKT